MSNLLNILARADFQLDTLDLEKYQAPAPANLLDLRLFRRTLLFLSFGKDFNTIFAVKNIMGDERKRVFLQKPLSAIGELCNLTYLSFNQSKFYSTADVLMQVSKLEKLKIFRISRCFSITGELQLKKSDLMAMLPLDGKCSPICELSIIGCQLQCIPVEFADKMMNLARLDISECLIISAFNDDIERNCRNTLEIILKQIWRNNLNEFQFKKGRICDYGNLKLILSELKLAKDSSLKSYKL